MKRVYAKEEVCMGCRLCEIHCAVQHSPSKNLLKAFKSQRPRHTSRVRVEESGFLSFALQCRHCPEPLCAYSCLTGALTKKGSTVHHDPDRCIGCWTCVAVCPYGALKVDAAQHRVHGKCDLCPDLDEPACVANCPNEALVYE